MKVILKQDVNKLGKKGDLLEVSDGHGRNFLIARGLAEEATPGRIKSLEESLKVKKAKDDKNLAAANAIKKKLSGKVVALAVTAGEGGKFFGSVTSAQISDAVKAQFGVEVDKKDIKIEEAVRQSGSYPVKIKLYPGVEAELTLKVEAEVR